VGAAPQAHPLEPPKLVEDLTLYEKVQKLIMYDFLDIDTMNILWFNGF
jgi:hypothetical protein